MVFLFIYLIETKIELNTCRCLKFLWFYFLPVELKFVLFNLLKFSIQFLSLSYEINVVYSTAIE